MYVLHDLCMLLTNFRSYPNLAFTGKLLLLPLSLTTHSFHLGFRKTKVEHLVTLCGLKPLWCSQFSSGLNAVSNRKLAQVHAA